MVVSFNWDDEVAVQGMPGTSSKAPEATAAYTVVSAVPTCITR
ncbi:protein of unknown function (plasmid) [Cupriavidus taiwanensis]|uniref:Uncharacterized protein n=1 Tax=Cupriavidus taiwanensis TaxID=164546 RepID=A0A375HA29_9BURK|nr:protein of unknown function [Cupriavidus taiwanensis]SOZ72090.1 protein of unknown function [Cupriavidus taiwanensis]SOZ74396.1 protein of unknown function [Cupriavidus taiwanensis]SPA03302.1 protein of unknown function [Cupriavidus taiwanensis]SPA11277.1 protein of unknown function [Cupriavidus taiwanensis]